MKLRVWIAKVRKEERGREKKESEREKVWHPKRFLICLGGSKKLKQRVLWNTIFSITVFKAVSSLGSHFKGIFPSPFLLSSCLSLPFPLSKISPSLTFRFYHTRAQITRQLSRIWKLEMLSTNRHLKKFRMPEMGQRFSHFLGKNFFFKCLSFERWWEKIFYAWWNNVWCCKNSFGSRMSRERERQRRHRGKENERKKSGEKEKRLPS